MQQKIFQRPAFRYQTIFCPNKTVLIDAKECEIEKGVPTALKLAFFENKIKK